MASRTVRITLEDIDDEDLGDVLRHLEDMGLPYAAEQTSHRSMTGWSTLLTEHEETPDAEH